MTHECIHKFKTISAWSFNKCFGNDYMTLSVWFQDDDQYMPDSWADIPVNFCPYCGLKAGVKVE